MSVELGVVCVDVSGAGSCAWMLVELRVVCVDVSGAGSCVCGCQWSWESNVWMSVELGVVHGC
jgi:hypothetical protein